ncbi:MAG: hypothetical protein IPK82_36735 [Polyangiaceae bacterium]|nr:hypothetical protein [Polyangiaceae bacterium]
MYSFVYAIVYASFLKGCPRCAPIQVCVHTVSLAQGAAMPIAVLERIGHRSSDWAGARCRAAL